MSTQSFRMRRVHIGCLVGALILPWLGGHYTHYLLCSLLIYALVSMSLNILIGFGGQVSIGHAGFWALGAYGSALLVTKLSAPFLVGILFGGLIAAVFGVLVSLPALRVQGHYLAIATLAFALVTQQVLYEWESLTGGRQGLFVSRPELGGYSLNSDFQYYFLLLSILVVFSWTTENFRKSRTGRAAIALKMSPVAAQCSGVNRMWHLVVAFTLSAFYTGISGGLFAHLIGYLSTETFTLMVSLSFLTMAVIGGLGRLSGAFLGAAYLTLTPEIFREFKNAQMVVYGLTVVLCLRFLPGGLASLLENIVRFFYRPDRAGSAPTALPNQTVPSSIRPWQVDRTDNPSEISRKQKTDWSVLTITQLTKSFAGLKAVNEVSFKIPEGSIFGLIGPNGAGKTTLLNCLSRVYAPESGNITFNGQEILKKPIHRMAELGICRTFQNLELFRESTVLENVLIGCHPRFRSNVLAEIVSLPGARRLSEAAKTEAEGILHQLGLTEHAHMAVSTLPFGTQKSVELARALAGKPRLLLLDEPAAGMNPEESRQVADIIRNMRDSLGITILLVEHDMSLVMTICDKIVVLDHGQKLCEGAPSLVQSNPEVIEAYLGKEEPDA